MPRIARSGLDALIGRQLRALRKQHGLTQGEIGTMLNVTGQQVYKIESGENRLYISQAYTLARHFAVSMDYFCPLPQPEGARGRANARKTSDVDAILELVRSKAGFELMSDFGKLKDEQTRKSVAAFVKAMAQREGHSSNQRRKRNRS